MFDNHDLHRSLNTEIITKTHATAVEIVLAKLVRGKNKVAFSLHISPNSFSSSGLQLTDFLRYIGFVRSPCSLLRRECYVREVPEKFDLDVFKISFDDAYEKLKQAQKYLNNCGFLLAQPEGLGYMFGSPSIGYSPETYSGSDGHTSGIAPELIKISEDDVFRFALTWIKTNERDKGWTIHYWPKHFPLSVELQSVFQFLDIKKFEQCPQFEFEPCHWRYIEFKQLSSSIWGSNVDHVTEYFDAHQHNFSRGINSLLAAQSVMEKANMGFLPSFAPPRVRRAQEISQRVIRPTQVSNLKIELNTSFDVAISFAGTDRHYAEELANKIKKAGFEVFYDGFFPSDLWGKNLIEFFQEIYSKRSRYCVVFVSKEYLDREWTIHERHCAQERMLKEKGNDYILPIQVDATMLPGLPSTIGYLHLATGIDKIAKILIKKLKKN